jgi:hypothetical protein
MTSDEFFARAGDMRFDVSFIDGYHTWEQALRDVENCLRHVPPDGVVLLHDCNPPNEAASMRDPEAASRHPDSDGSWCGDVWKAIVQLRATRPDLRVEVLDADFGVGFVRRGSSDPIGLDADAVADLTYADLARDRGRLLGLRSP